MKENVKENLQAVSQHPVWNAWHEIRFGLHKDYGVSGASPLEILHWILLGQYKYSREALFLQTGEYSNLGKAINGHATSIGILLQRQSDKDLPRTTFSRGLNTSGLSGHEMTGMILCLTATLRSAQGRNELFTTARGKQKGFFPDENYIRDWINLLETQLELEQWLKLKELPVVEVERAKTKFRELMGLVKQVGKRAKGMGYKTMNFHGTIHVPEAILNFGVPSNVNTAPNKSHHKRDKKTAKSTQFRPDTIDVQTAKKKTTEWPSTLLVKS